MADLEKKVVELKQVEDAQVSALARVAALEDTMYILRSEQESKRATTR